MLRIGQAALALIAAAVVAAGCGGSDDGDSGDGSGSSSNGPATVRIATSPIADVAPLFLGVEQKFFADRDITIEEQFVESGAVVVPAVVQGSFQAGFANSITVLSAQQQGLDLRVLAVAASGGESRKDGYAPLMVRKDSGITDAKGLEGKTVAIASLDSIDEIATKEALENQGANVEDVKFIEVPRPDMIGALDAGRVDAATIVEPFAVEAQSTGRYRVILDEIADAAPTLPTAVYFTTGSYVDENADVSKRLAEGLRESLAYATANPEAIRKIVPTYTSISPELAERMKMPPWTPPDTDEWSLQTAKKQMTVLAELGVKQGVLTEVPDIDQLFSSYPGS